MGARYTRVNTVKRPSPQDQNIFRKRKRDTRKSMGQKAIQTAQTNSAYLSSINEFIKTASLEYFIRSKKRR